MLHATDLAMLEALDNHRNVRRAMITTAVRDDPNLRAAAEAADLAASRAASSSDDGGYASRALRESQEMIWYNRVVQRPTLFDEDDGKEFEPPPPTAQPRPRTMEPLARAASATQPCLLGVPLSPALPKLVRRDDALPGTDARERPSSLELLRRGRSQQQQTNNSSDDAPAAAPRPVTAAAARRIHGRASMYLMSRR